ncbi:acetyl esterase [Rhizobium sp. BK529]|uniref:alpha/beta hydrolase n=1 Tax=unclassified Rhizobium TaxID=2613769 RepID=UPI0010454084|nr:MULTISPECIES: alpha/beta hydrolase [unclassified Rhizobium]MBB3594064.1 acetyl esterase [Rhizobium sp. BK529]TCS01519.1 acetyl esterase [Rhizobium sp. BK418]
MSAPGADISLLSPEMAALLARVAAEDGPLPDVTTLLPTEGRVQSEKTNRRWNLDLPPMESAREIWIEPDATLGSARIRIRLLVPRAKIPGTLLFVHGGGFAFCSPETHERCARVLAQETGMAVLVPDYRLAPEHPYPAGLMDVIACLRKLQSSPDIFGVEAGPIVIAGDSAGANLALAAILHEQQQADRPVLAGALLFYGTFARDFTTPSYRAFAEGPGLTRGKMQRYWQWYVGDRDVGHDPLACPLTASDDALAALPPLHLMAAAVDPLLSDTLILHQRLQSLGRSETVTVTPGVTHGFLQNTIDLAAAREALSAAAQKAKEMTDRM